LTSSHSAEALSELDDLVELGLLLDAVELGAIGDVVVDRLRERVRFLEHHADAPPHLGGRHVGGVQVDALIDEGALDTRPANQIVHPVEATQHGRLAATRWPDERRDLVLVDRHVDVAYRPKGAVVDAEVGQLKDHLIVHTRFFVRNDLDVNIDGLFVRACDGGVGHG
jgi:hypothetical protein